MMKLDNMWLTERDKMKLFIDSTQKIFVAALLNDNNTIEYKVITETKYKVEEIINFFDKLSKLDSIKEIYINLGPGSFTGSRIALLYVRTLSQLNSNINIFTTNSYELLDKQNHSNAKSIFYINATKTKSYSLSKNKVEIIDKVFCESQINYEEILNNFSFYQSIFVLSSFKNIQPIYASNPQIGEVKK